MRPIPPTLLLAALLLPGCRSAAPGPDEPDSPYRRPDAPPPPTIGFFLAEFDASLRAWNRLRLTAGSDDDARTLRTLENEMAHRAAERRDELVDELEFGPPQSRPIAAAALGFTADPSVQGPLLNALADGEPQVVQHALLALGLLELPDTPTAQIGHLLRQHPDPWTRNNAAYALQRIALAGGRSEDIVASSRQALFDEEPGVRAQAAATLGVVADAGARERLQDLLYDDHNLVASAAAASLGRIATEHAEAKGPVARALVDALARVPPSRQARLLRELARLSDVPHGDDVQAWREWAYRLP